ncbi:MarR family winged helix-turn-helix transcriptional regulator [Pseudonocardia sp. RS010]|uniref:MarR family winged helix-turn-helix transcriptional regulator n=1 Tax=Pseudonocardia sp. RS010 TaxID=3385979 RepID=UPI0039A12BDD
MTDHASADPEASSTPWLDEGEQRFWRAWILSSTLLENRLNRDLQEAHGLSHGDYGVLGVLSEQEGHRMRMSVLAEMLALSKSRLSHQVSRMEKAGLVRRDGDVSDGRGIFACLTPHGHERLVAAAPTHVTGVRKYVVDLLDTEERAQAAVFLERVAARLRDCS